MEKFIKLFIKKLYELYDYKIAELEGVSGLSSNWCSIKMDGSFAQVFVFSNIDNVLDIDKGLISEKIKAQTNCFYINVFVICLVSKNYSDKIEDFRNSNFTGIIMDIDNNVVVYYHGVEDNVINEVYHCFKLLENPKSQVTKRPKSAATYSLIAINIAAYILTAYLSKDIVTSNINVLVLLGAKVNNLILNGEYFRLVTCMFLHGGIIHLVLNMYALYAIGPLIENIYGRKKYIVIYFISGILSSILSFVFSPSVSIGASGAIFGILGASLVFGIKMKNRIGKEFMLNIITVIGINLFVGFSMPNVDNFGHLGGLIGGIISSLILLKKQ